MIWNFIIQLAIGVGLAVISYLLTPKPKKVKPPEARDQENPIAEAGSPVMVVFGTMTVKGGNIMYYADKEKLEYEIDV